MKATGRVSAYVKKHLEDSILGHPSNNNTQKIKRLESLVFELARQIDSIRHEDSDSEEYPCYNCQGGGCPVCNGFGKIKY